MPITPIEVLSMANKTQEAAFVKHAEIQKPVTEQEAIASNFKSQLQQNSEKTVAPSKSENPEYRYDAKDKGNNTFYNQQQKKDKQKKKEHKQEKPTHVGIDIRI